MQKNLIYNRISAKFYSKNKAHDKGFTLVELIVVLALMAIILGVTIFGGLAWQDYSRFNHEEAVAEDIFFAAQNQLTEFDASGAMESKIVKILQDEDGNYPSNYILASAAGDKTKLESISYESGESEGETLKYSWDNIWKAFFRKNSKENQKGTILTLYAKKGDYDRYLADLTGQAYDGTLGDDAKLLFNIVAPYISDTSVLNGCILLEFSPEAGQVFSVCYSDVAANFDYEAATSGGTVNVSDRRLQIRKDNMVGYYSVNQLHEKLRGKAEYDSKLRFDIKSDNLFELVVHDNEGDALKVDDILSFELYKGDTGASETTVMSFDVKYKDSSNPNQAMLQADGYSDGLLAAVKNPTPVEITFGMGEFSGQTISFNLPVWTDKDGDIHIVLDATDIEAQSYAYYKAFIYSKVVDGTTETGTDEEKENFRTTYSFYRFGLSQDVHYLYGKVFHTDANGVMDSGTNSKRAGLKTAENPDGRMDHKNCPDSETHAVGECTVFDRYYIEGDTNRIEIANARHLYNMRYETDYKKNASVKNVFKLTADIDWNEFVGKGDEDLTNYFVSSYDASLTSGIGLKVTSDYTQNWPFPGFRCLDKNDVFTQDKAEGEEITQQEQDAGIASYKISNLTISITSNIRYGIYDNVFYDPMGTFGYTDEEKDELVGIKNRCVNFDDFTGIIGLKEGDGKGSARSKLARAGRLPLGLFAENLGTISNIALDKHIVRGMETVGDDKNIIYSCMVGGFAGNNMGTVSKLTLLDSAKEEKGSINNKTHINGRTDVGGIIGRQSFSVTSGTDVKLSELKNEGSVTGYENVGGIVGRAYVHYVDDKDNTTQISAYDKNNGKIKGAKGDEVLRPRYDYYHDGYKITDDGLSITGLHVYRTATISIEKCENSGKISGDSIIYDTQNHYIFDGVDLGNKNNVISKYTHCAFIGGIAGITQDGYIIDDESESISTGHNLTLYRDKNYYNGKLSYISVNECKNEVLYDKTEITTMEAEFSDGKSKSQDCYVGGLIGYARLTSISDCSNDVADDKECFSDSKIPLVMGRNYVGGLVGCSDESIFKTSSSRTNYAVNYNLVIGEKYVGGIAGGFGIGDVTPGTLSFKEPAKNEASQPSFIDMDPNNNSFSGRKLLNTRLLNKGIVLAVKNNRNLNYVTDKKNQDGTAGIKNENSGSGMVGGIAGASHLPILDGNNKQSRTTKEYNLELIGFSDNQINDFSSVTKEDAASVAQSSPFGGTAVGGIIGGVLKYGYINRGKLSNAKTNSYINAVVFGQDYVGGGAGMISEEGYTNCYNFYPSMNDVYNDALDGMIVIGRDCVGGIAGDVRQKYNFEDDRSNTPLEAPFTVYGRYAVGGAYGALNTNYGNGTGVQLNINLNNSGNKIHVNGIAYVGGHSGVCLFATPYLKDKNATGSNISDIVVNGKYFAGGVFGAYDGSPTMGKDYKYTYLGPLKWSTSDSKLSISRVTVNADVFGGGFVGLYTVGMNNDNRRSFISLDSKYDPCGQLYTVAEKLKNGSEYVDYDIAFDRIVNEDVYNQNLFMTNDSNHDFTLNGDNVYKNTVTVNSKLFAGGIFGYVPEKQKMTVYNITNEASLTATESVGGENGIKVDESSNDKDTFAYLGGIIGRVPRGMVLSNCKNTAKGSDLNADVYYSAPKATYLGGLTEVNAGVIKDCTNDTEFKYGSGGVGAFTGVNGTDVTAVKSTGEGENIAVDVSSSAISDLQTTGVIYNCKNNAKIESTDGFVGGMSASDGGMITAVDGKRNSAIYCCINIGNLIGKDTAGMVAKPSGTDIISKCRNYGLNQATETHYGIAGGTVGNIAKNLEAGGLSIKDTVNDPIAPMNSDDLVRNFYISDTVMESDLDKKPNLINNGSVYFDIQTDSENLVMAELIQKFYNQTDREPQTSDKLRTMTNDSSDYDVTFKVKDNFEGSGLKMNSFDIVWSNGETASEQTYVYYVSFKYKDESDQEHTTAPARREIVQDKVAVVDTIEVPDRIKGLGITEVSIHATADDMIGISDKQVDSVTIPYYYAYWTDANYKHYIWDATNAETIGSGDGVYFYSTAKRTDDSSVAESGTDADHPDVYNLQPATSIPADDEELEANFKKINVSYDATMDDSSKQIYDNSIMIESPSDGLEMDYFRIYWLDLNSQYIQYKYTVAFTYLDDSYNPQTVYYDRVINPMSASQDVLCYDEIPAQVNGQSIRPVGIEVYVDGGGANLNYYYSAMTWGKITRDENENEIGRTERVIADYDNRYELTDPVKGLVDLDKVALYYQECSHDTANEKVRFNYQGDRWSKQLTCVKLNNAYYNLVYSKGGVYQRDDNKTLIKLLPSSLQSTTDLNSLDPQDRYNKLDNWFMTQFVDDYSNYPNKMFVGDN